MALLMGAARNLYEQHMGQHYLVRLFRIQSFPVGPSYATISPDRIKGK